MLPKTGCTSPVYSVARSNLTKPNRIVHGIAVVSRSPARSQSHWGQTEVSGCGLRDPFKHPAAAAAIPRRAPCGILWPEVVTVARNMRDSVLAVLARLRGLGDILLRQVP